MNPEQLMAAAKPQEVKPKKDRKHEAGNGNDAPKDTAPRDRTSKNFDKTAAITMLVAENPKRVGSKAHGTFKKYTGATTVGDFIANGGTYEALAWDSARGYITIVGYTPKLVEKKARKAKPEAPAGEVKDQPAA